MRKGGDKSKLNTVKDDPMQKPMKWKGGFSSIVEMFIYD